MYGPHVCHQQDIHLHTGTDPHAAVHQHALSFSVGLCSYGEGVRLRSGMDAQLRELEGVEEEVGVFVPWELMQCANM
jgi:hypothetical protein